LGWRRGASRNSFSGFHHVPAFASRSREQK
jgi:hypothetical protein